MVDRLLTTAVAHQKATGKLAGSTNSCAKREELEELAISHLLSRHLWLPSLL